MTDAIRSAAVQARELADLLDGYLNSPQQVALGEELRSVLDSALAAAPAPQPSDERILHLWDTHVAYETGCKGARLSDKDKLAFARAVLAASPSPQQDASAFRDAVLEEAAKRCDQINDDSGGGFEPFAEAIRAMKGQP